MPKIAVKAEEVEQLLNACVESEETGHTDFPSMTYEQGIKAGLEWAMGDNREHPLIKD